MSSTNPSDMNCLSKAEALTFKISNELDTGILISVNSSTDSVESSATQR
jgi:hypothetical protein